MAVSVYSVCMVDDNKHYDRIDLPRAVIAGTVMGAGIGLSFFGGSLEKKSDWVMLVRETALCSTLSGAVAFVGAVIHNQTSMHNREERERARSVVSKETARTV